jgi:hypothetical protein
MSPAGLAKGEVRNAQHAATPVSARGRFQALVPPHGARRVGR